MWLLSGIVLWYLLLADNDTLLNICRGYHLTMVTREQGM